jgi:hypothetical protein
MLTIHTKDAIVQTLGLRMFIDLLAKEWVDRKYQFPSSHVSCPETGYSSPGEFTVSQPIEDRLRLFVESPTLCTKEIP